MAVITNPQFPPISGMVEDIDEHGNQILTMTNEQLEKENQQAQVQKLQTENKTLEATVTALTQSNANLEECLVEMAGIVYA